MDVPTTPCLFVIISYARGGFQSAIARAIHDIMSSLRVIFDIVTQERENRRGGWGAGKTVPAIVLPANSSGAGVLQTMGHSSRGVFGAVAMTDELSANVLATTGAGQSVNGAAPRCLRVQLEDLMEPSRPGHGCSRGAVEDTSRVDILVNWWDTLDTVAARCRHR